MSKRVVGFLGDEVEAALRGFGLKGLEGLGGVGEAASVPGRRRQQAGWR